MSNRPGKTECVEIRLPGSSGIMRFRRIPAGSFRMGSRGVTVREEPIHVVKIAQPFWMGEAPVTQAQFEVWTKAKRVNHKNHFEGKSNHPAENMTWAQANQFCEWFTQTCKDQLPGDVVRACLPTEAEWEYACRAGTEAEYYSGDGEAALAEVGWFGEEWNKGSTHEVGSRGRDKDGRSTHPFGLLDMHGNVWEWCHDEWNETAYRERIDDANNPGEFQRHFDWRAGVENFTKNEDRNRVMRGGSWVDSPVGCRSACRIRLWWSVDRVGSVGFRVCLVPGPLKTESQT